MEWDCEAIDVVSDAFWCLKSCACYFDVWGDWNIWGVVSKNESKTNCLSVESLF